MKQTIIPQEEKPVIPSKSYKKNQSRLSLYGRPATKDQIAAEVKRLRLGSTEKNIKPLTWSQIATALNYQSKTIYNYRDYLLETKQLNKNEDGTIEAPAIPKFTNFETFNKKHVIINHPIVEEWRKNLMLRKQGKPLGGMNTYIRNVEIVCNTLKINPEQLLIGLKESEKYLQNFLILYQEGKAAISYRYQLGQVDMQNIAYFFSKAIRDLMNINGLSYPRGTTGVMSQKVPNHGNYADIRLTDEELKKADSYLIENHGIDSDVYRAFWIGVESCSRHGALFGMNLTYVKDVDPENNETTYIMEAFESKTSQIKGGKWIKYIKRPQTQKSIDTLRDIGGNKFYDDTKKRKLVDITTNVREDLWNLYVYLGKISDLDELKKLRKEKIKTHNYYFEHAFHVLRHIGAHYWLNLTDYNHSLVAKIGGWNTIDELKNSYGEMPPEVVLKLLRKTRFRI